MVRIQTGLLMGALLLASGCAEGPFKDVGAFFQTAKGNGALATGMKQYEDGDYSESTRNLRNALDLGLSSNDQAKAHKTLAFISCVSGRERQCREEFGKALDVDPKMNLEPAESGHPIWGPVFRSVKANR
jgi:Tfp pilus assembly protein PilF